ncbi:MAG: penicillin-binding transpeptidase domain-containing protein [Clostridium sp.]
MIVQRPDKKKKMSRYTVLNIIMLTIFGVIVIKLLYLQVYKHEDYRERADVSSTRFVAENAPRGKIYDSKGNVLASNTQTYTLTYTKTEEAQKEFYSTMDKVFKILAENGEKFQDDLLLKIDSNGKYYYDFKVDDAESRKAVEKLFKRDRGINEVIERQLYKDHKGDFTDQEIDNINTALMKISPEDTFYELVKIYDMYELILDPELKGSAKSDKISEYLDMTGKEITDLLLEKYSINDIRNYMVIKDTIKMQSFKGYRAVTIASNIKKDTAFILMQKLNDLPGIDVSLTPVRYYPYKNLGSSVLGYMSSIGSWEEETYALQGYDASSDLIGTAGIESAFEEQLKGNKGGSTIKVNSKGKETEKLFELESHPGNNVHLTIDKDVQYAAQQALADQIKILTTTGINGEIWKSATRGAVVAIEVKTGRILAMASAPDYDPNLFAIPGLLTPEQSEQYFNPDLEKFGKEFMSKTGATGELDKLFYIDPDTGLREDSNDVYPRSFFNYATLGLIPPGSSFKPITAVAGLEEGVFSIGETVNDTGIFNIHPEMGYNPTNYGKLGNGPTDVKRALEKSSNFYFFETEYRIYHKYGGGIEGKNKLAEYAWKFGLGSDPNGTQKPGTGIEIPERIGTMYSFDEYKASKISSAIWSLVDVLKKGHYGAYSFIPFDIEKSDDDSDELRDAKKKLKDKVLARLQLVGLDVEKDTHDEFGKSIEPEILNIMKLSTKYKDLLASSKGNIEAQVGIISNAIQQFTIDQETEMTIIVEPINAAIGQGMSNFTPIEIANYAATLANNGVRNRVRLVDKITSPDGKVIQEFQTEQVDKIDIKPENYEAVKDGMWRVINQGNGYAQDVFRGFPIKAGGKTGTADFKNDDEEYKKIGRQPYSTFIGMAPLDNPEIAVFSVIYDGSRGSFASMPARAVFEAYFKDELLKDPSYPSKSPMFKRYVTDSPFKDNKDTPEAVTAEVPKKEN